jgi:hypothetical protein
MVSTMYAWLPSYLNRYYGLAPDQAGLKTGLVILVGGVAAIVWSVVADRLSARFPRARLHVPGDCGRADDRVHVRCLRDVVAGVRTIRADHHGAPR